MGIGKEVDRIRKRKNHIMARYGALGGEGESAISLPLCVLLFVRFIKERMGADGLVWSGLGYNALVATPNTKLESFFVCDLCGFVSAVLTIDIVESETK